MKKTISEKLSENYYRVTLPYAELKENPAVHTAYVEEQNRLYEEFREDLFEDLGIVGNPKADLLFSKAYSKGHSCGFSDVYSIACDFVDLIL